MDGQDAAETRYRAPALDKGLDILEILAKQSTPLTRTEIVRGLGLSPSQIYRMLERLVARGYVTRHEGGDRYSLSMRLFLLGAGFPPLRRLTAQAQPLMDQFARDHRQSCHLVVPANGTGVVVAQAGTASHWQFSARVGAQLDLFETSSGHTLLACQASERMEETYGQWGIVDAKKKMKPIQSELDVIRAQGYRFGPSSQIEGVTDISVPVLDPRGDAFAALSCAYLKRVDGTSSDPNALLDSLRKAAVGMAQYALSGN